LSFIYQKPTEFLNKITGGDEIDAGWIDMNPSKIEHRVNSYFGGPAKFAEEMLTSVYNVYKGEDFSEDPIFRKVPFAKRFFQKSGTTYQERNRYYETSDVLQNLKDRYKLALDEAKVEKAQQIINEDPVKFGMIDLFDSYSNTIKKYNKDIAQLREADEDRYKDKIDSLYDQRDELMKQFNDEYYKRVTKPTKKGLIDLMREK
jgi:hypothetical protein